MAIIIILIFTLYLLLACLISIVSSTSTSHSYLNGQHLRVLALEFPVSMKTERNATGHVIYMEGVLHEMIVALSEMFNFSYSYLPVSVLLFDNSPSAKGAVSYLTNDEVDYVLSTTIGTSARFENVDYPAPWVIGSFGIMLPYPKEALNFTASFEPLSYEAWLLTFAALIAIFLCLRFLNSDFFQRLSTTKGQRYIIKTSIFQYVIRNLFSQGQSCFSRRLAIRIAAGAWALGCFFIVQIYCSTLTSHLTSPNQKPIINSFSELANTPGIGLTVDRGFGFDTILQQKNVLSGHAKQVGDLLKNDPNSLRCNVTVDCMEKVRGGHAVYIAPPNSLKWVIDKDLKNTSTCNYGMLKDYFWCSSVFTALQKNSRYTEEISRGILQLKAAGLLDLWEKRYVPLPRKCLEFNQRKPKPRLSIGNLSSAFVILFVGYALSILTFLIEKIVSFVHRNN